MKNDWTVINHLKMRYFASLSIFFLSLLLSACTTPQPSIDVAVAANPSSKIIDTVTNFDDALTCMDNLFLTNKIKNIVITSAGLPDETGMIHLGSKDIMISAISKLSTQSHSFQFVDFDPKALDISLIYDMVRQNKENAKKFILPQYYIRGAITQFDQNVLANNIDVGLQKEQGTLSVKSGNIASIISMDVNIVKMVSRQIISGVQSNNSIAINQTSSSGNITGKLSNAIIPFQLNYSRNEGIHTAVRNLIQLSLIETLGKLTSVPYWQCLGIPSTAPEARKQALKHFKALSSPQKTVKISQALKELGYLTSETSLQSAISLYQKDNDLIADGRITFNLYSSLLNRRAVKHTFVAEPLNTQVNSVPLKKIKTPVGLYLKASKAKDIYQVGDSLKASITVTENAYVYCYYQDAKKRISRIFPNRFSPDSFVAASTPIALPSGKAGYKLIFDEKASSEAIVCFAARTEVGLHIPTKYKAIDLTPIDQSSLDEVISIYYSTGGAGLAHKTLRFNVQ